MAAILESAGPPSPPVRASTLDPPRPRCVELVVVSGDDALLEQVGRALDGDSTVRQADSPDEARACLRPATPCVLLVDTRGHDDVARLVADLQAPDGSSVLIAFAPAEACAEVARAVRRRSCGRDARARDRDGPCSRPRRSRCSSPRRDGCG